MRFREFFSWAKHRFWARASLQSVLLLATWWCTKCLHVPVFWEPSLMYLLYLCVCCAAVFLWNDKRTCMGQPGWRRAVYQGMIELLQVMSEKNRGCRGMAMQLGLTSRSQWKRKLLYYCLGTKWGLITVLLFSCSRSFKVLPASVSCSVLCRYAALSFCFRTLLAQALEWALPGAFSSLGWTSPAPSSLSLLQPSEPSSWLLDPLWQLHIFLVLCAPGLDTDRKPFLFPTPAWPNTPQQTCIQPPDTAAVISCCLARCFHWEAARGGLDLDQQSCHCGIPSWMLNMVEKDAVRWRTELLRCGAAHPGVSTAVMSPSFPPRALSYSRTPTSRARSWPWVRGLCPEASSARPRCWSRRSSATWRSSARNSPTWRSSRLSTRRRSGGRRRSAKHGRRSWQSWKSNWPRGRRRSRKGGRSWSAGGRSCGSWKPPTRLKWRSFSLSRSSWIRSGSNSGRTWSDNLKCGWSMMTTR